MIVLGEDGVSMMAPAGGSVSKGFDEGLFGEGDGATWRPDVVLWGDDDEGDDDGVDEGDLLDDEDDGLDGFDDDDDDDDMDFDVDEDEDEEF